MIQVKLVRCPRVSCIASDMAMALRIVCSQEIAWRNGWIGDRELEAIVAELGDKSSYGQYLNGLLKQPA